MPIRSMTAFAAGERTTPAGMLAGELRSVNHRHLEIGFRLAEELRALEPVLRERIGARVSRGKLDLAMRLRGDGAGAAPVLDEAMLDQVAALHRQLAARLGSVRVDMAQLLALPGVLRVPEVDAEALHGEALRLLDAMLDDFVAAREREGAALAAAIGTRVDAIERIVGEVRALMPAIREGQRGKLQARLGELAQGMDPARLEQELVLWLQKLDADEELDRLGSHLAELRRALRGAAPAGRRLDFLLQEVNREANTLGSKSVDARTSNAVVELKVLIDQIREQVQNVE